MTIFRYPAWIAAIFSAAVIASTAIAQDAESTTRAMLAKWAGSYDTDALLREPKVRAELQKLLGAELQHLESNLNVSGAVEVISETLSISGNAPHQGTEEEAIVCILPYNMTVEAAILSQGVITVFTHATQYEYIDRCIKDWITLANSGHIDRMKPPANVRMANTPR
jgi:hypothetical protein